MVQLTSFLLGVGAAWALPAVVRVIRPLIVETAVASMALFEEGRRLVAEQIETIEDIAAEARSRREESLSSSNGHHAIDLADAAEPGPGDEPERGRRRGERVSRRRTA